MYNIDFVLSENTVDRVVYNYCTFKNVTPNSVLLYLMDESWEEEGCFTHFVLKTAYTYSSFEILNSHKTNLQELSGA